MLADRERGGKRTLDLQANSHDEVSVWTRYFRQVVEAPLHVPQPKPKPKPKLRPKLHP